MVRKTLIAIIMLLVSNAGFALNNNRNGLVAKGDSCVTENDYFHALDYFLQAQKIRDTKDLQMKIADCYYCRYQLKECITILEKIKEDSLSHDAFKELYYAYGAMENPSTQEIYGYALIRRFPMDSKILASLMHLIIDNDKYGTRQFQAVEFGEKYYKKDSDNVEVNRALAQAYFFSQKYDKSLNMYQRLLQEKDTTFSGLYYTGLCYEYLHNLDSAKVYLQKAVNLSPKNPVGMYRLGMVESQLHLNLEAISHLETAAQLYQPSPTLMRLIYKNLGQSEAESGNKAKALEAWKKALAYEPDDDITSKIKQISASK